MLLQITQDVHNNKTILLLTTDRTMTTGYIEVQGSITIWQSLIKIVENSGKTSP